MNKRTNRKTEYFGEYFEHNGEWLQILSNETYGVYKEILTKTIEQLDFSIETHKRILVVRFDLHVNLYTGDNKRISNFMNNIRNFLGRKYDIKKIGYIWARESEKSKKQHYHLVLFLDGNKIQHPKKLLRQLTEKWLPFGHLHKLRIKEKGEKYFYYIDKNNTTTERAEAIRHM